MRHYYIYLLMTLCALLSCQREKFDVTGDCDTACIDVGLSLQVSHSEEAGPGASTRAVADDPAADPITPVMNLWVVQYQGTDDKAVVVGKPQYISEYEAGVTTLRLLPTPEKCRVVIIANTFNETLSFYQGSTLASLKDKINDNISSQADVLGHDVHTASADAHFPEDNSYYPILCGVSDYLDGIDAATNVSVILKRNVAKLVINVTNTSAGTETPVTIHSVRLLSVPDRSLYLTNYDNTSTAFPDVFPDALSMGTIDYPAVEWDSSNPSLTQTFTFYSPVNKRGQIARGDDDDPKTKWHVAPMNATYFIVSGSYIKNDKTIPVTFKFYAGANLTDDFNLEANKVYTYNIEIRDISNIDKDQRVDTWPDVDFTTWPDANSYILNPADAAGEWRTFRIPVRRANTFWGYDTDASKKPEYDLDNQQKYFILTNTQWKVEVIYADFPINPSNFSITKAEGIGYIEDGHFEVSVPSDTRGNVLVGIKCYKDGEWLGYLWSWHLWITDYDPYPASKISKANAQYTYYVVNGKVHRYEGASWHNASGDATYENDFIMDRNLGRLSEYSTGSGQGAIYYQFGRKDPFPGTECYDAMGQKKSQFIRKQEKYSDTEPANHLNKDRFFNNMPYLVLNPTVFNMISSTGMYYTTFDDQYNPKVFDGSTVWQDPNTKTGAVREGGKSLFDPCPPGWCIPSENIWSDFYKNTDTKHNPTTNCGGYTVRSFKNFSKIGGLMYWPYVKSASGADNYDVTDFVFYPRTQYRSPYYKNGGIEGESSIFSSLQHKASSSNAINQGGYVWAGNRFHLSSSGVQFYNSGVDHYNYNNNCSGECVRCISIIGELKSIPRP